MQYRPEALAIPALRDAEKLAALMGLKVQYYPLYDCKGIGGIIFFADGELMVREEPQGFEAETPRTIQIKANTIVVYTNAVRRNYAAFDIFP